MASPWEPVHVTLQGERAFEDVIKDPERRYPGLSGWAVNPMTRVLTRDRHEGWAGGGADLTQRGEGHVKSEVETRVLQPPAKGHSEPPETRRGGEGPSPRTFGGNTVLLTP